MFAAETTHEPKLKILVVDDNQALLDLLSELLSFYGHEAVCATSREAALEVIDEGGFNAALVDIWMSGRADGVALARELQTRFPAVPFTYMSGYSETSMDKFLPLEERKQVLHKPFGSADIIKFLGSAARSAAVA